MYLLVFIIKKCVIRNQLCVIILAIQNDTASSQLGYLNLLHKTTSQKITLPCDADGPFSLLPYRSDAPITIGGRQNSKVKITTGPCHMV